jgi:hypothetical protein
VRLWLPHGILPKHIVDIASAGFQQTNQTAASKANPEPVDTSELNSKFGTDFKLTFCRYVGHLA